MQTKLQFQTLLHQVVPAYRGGVGTLYSQVALVDFPTTDAVLAVSEDVLAERIASHCPSRSARWAREKPRTLADAAQTNPFRAVRVPRQLFTLTM